MTPPRSSPGCSEARQRFAEMLRIWWSFNDGQRHSHTWHSREDFIEKVLPEQLDLYVKRIGAGIAQGQQEPLVWRVLCTTNGATGYLYTEQLPFNPGPGVHVREEPEPLYTGFAQNVPGGFVLVPRELTAENGAKTALIGDFSEAFEYMDDEGDECTAHIQVSWTTIKEIHKAMVKHFDTTPEPSTVQALTAGDQDSNAAAYGNSPREIQRRALKAMSPISSKLHSGEK